MDITISNIQQIQNHREKCFAATKRSVTGLISVPYPCTLVTDDGNSYEISADTHMIAFDQHGHVWPVTHKFIQENYSVLAGGLAAWHMVQEQTCEVKDGSDTGKS